MNLSPPPNRIGGYDWATPTIHRSARQQVHPSSQDHEQQRDDGDGTSSTHAHHPRSWDAQDPVLFLDISPDAHSAPSRSRSTCPRLVRSCLFVRWRSWEGRTSLAGTSSVCSQPMGRLPGVTSGDCARARVGGDGRATRRWHSCRTDHVVEPIRRRLAWLGDDQHRMHRTDIYECGSRVCAQDARYEMRARTKAS